MTLPISTKSLPCLWLLAAVACPLAMAQKPAPAAPEAVPAIIQEAVNYQLDDFKHTTWALRYRVHRVDTKDDTTRELVESSGGNIARTLTRHGRPLTAEENSAEEDRLRAITPADLAKHRHNGESTEKFGVELIKVMPQAMTYTLAPNQPQIPGLNRPQIALDFVPNPRFHPASTTQSLLQGISGHLWVDAETHHLLRIEITITQNLNLVFGILARVYQGGTLSYDQRPVGNGHYAYTHMDINVKLRELMVKVVPFHSTYDTTNMELLPQVPSYKDAVNMLLNTKP